MQTYDITLTISPDLVTWPGNPGIIIERVKKIEQGDNSNVTKIEIGAHTGTHVDAPFHFLPEGKSAERLQLKALTGRVYVLSIPDVDVINAKVLEEADIPPRTRRLLFKTRNSQYWASHTREFQPDFVGISEDGAELLVKRGVKLVGIDYLSISPYHHSRPTHEIFLKAGVVIVEGLDLSEINQGRYTLFCLPMKIAGSDGAPARAILIGV
jgi:arylformamidase